MLTFYEFFAGGGMARMGLGSKWECLFANDIDEKKSRSYVRNWTSNVLTTCDIAQLNPADLPGHARLSWASFPCQDLSLAGEGAGLTGKRSGTFWAFWNLMEALKSEARAPDIIVLENVIGTLTSHDGHDYRSICAALSGADYTFGGVVIDAELFVPQSRPRLFIIAVRNALNLPAAVSRTAPSSHLHTKALLTAYAAMPETTKKNWVWWHAPLPKRRENHLIDLIEEPPTGVRWHTKAETEKLLTMMSERNRIKVKDAAASGGTSIGTIYKRTRRDPQGFKVQRAEVRFDGVAGCLRTPVGGSSRQLLLVVEDQSIRSRLISGRETARLMGLPDSYLLPDNYNETYHLTGDGVAVPVVRYLAEHILEPIAAVRYSGRAAA